MGHSDVADLSQSEQRLNRRGGFGTVDLRVEDVEDENVEVIATHRAQQRVDLTEDSGAPESNFDVVGFTHGHAHSGQQQNLFGKSQLSEHLGGDRGRAGELDEVATCVFILVDEALGDLVIDPVPPLEGPETHIADFQTGGAEALVLHAS